MHKFIRVLQHDAGRPCALYLLPLICEEEEDLTGSQTCGGRLWRTLLLLMRDLSREWTPAHSAALPL